MTVEIALFLALLLAAIVLFSTEWISADVTALGLMLTLIITGLLPFERAFAGFGSPTVMMILGLLILTEALMNTGAVDYVEQWLARNLGERPQRVSLSLLVIPGAISSIISNTASVAFFLPITLGLARRANIHPSKLLMPLGFASILASSVTLIGTSTNLVVSGLMEQQGLDPLGMVEMTPVGLPILAVGLLYLHFWGRRLIPVRDVPTTERQLEQTLYLSEVVVVPNSNAIGKRIEETRLLNELGLGLLRLVRGDETLKPLADTILQARDVLFVQGTRENIMAISQSNNFALQGVLRSFEDYIQSSERQVAEVVLLPGSPLIGRNIKGLRLRERFGLQILAINQHGEITYSKIGRRTLRLGDVLLIQIPPENLRLLSQDKLFRVLDIVDANPMRQPHKARQAGLIFAGSILLAAVGILPTSVAVMVGAVAVFVSRCITPEEAYRGIEWKALILIGSMLAFGQAMTSTGTADYLANQLVIVAGDISPTFLLGLFFLLAVALTQPMSNQAAAAVLVPVAMSTALQLDYDPRPFAIMIAVAASCSFLTPLEPATVIIYGSGRYKFFDFARVGLPLTVLVFLIAVALVPRLWAVS